MMKRMKQAVSYFMAICLLAGNSYTGGMKTEVSLMPFVSTAETAAEEDVSAKEAVQSEKTQVPFFNSIHTAVDKIGSLFNHEVKSASAAEEEPWYYGLALMTSIMKDGEVMFIENKSLNITIQKYKESDNKPVQENTIKKVDFVSENTNVISINPTGDTSANLVIHAPGWVILNATITCNDGTTGTFRCGFMVEAELDRKDDVWVDLQGKNGKVLVLNPEKMDSYQLQFEGLPDANITSLYSFGDPDVAGIVSIDKNTGKLTIDGAGHTTIAYKSYADVSDLNGVTKPEESIDKYIDVIVLPTGGYQTNDETAYKREVNVRVAGTPGETGTDFILHTNAIATEGNKLNWKVSKVNYDGTTEELKDNTLISYKTAGKDLYFSGVKAGTYLVEGYVKTNGFDVPEGLLQPLKFNVIVELNLQTSKKSLNILDLYDFDKATNIPDGIFGKLFSVVPTDREVYAKMDLNTGIVSAISNGRQEYEIKYSPQKGYELYTQTEMASSSSLREYTYTFDIIDSLSVDPGVATLYKGGSIDLDANTTLGDVMWECSDADKKYISLDEKTGKVTANEVTPSGYWIKVYAYKYVDGIKKTAECRIRILKAPSDITLYPEEVTIAIDEIKSIEAVSESDDWSDINLTWSSSDPDIFEVMQESATSTSVKIKGISGGTATLIGVNADNVYVACCKVTVEQPVQDITLSESKVTGLKGETHHLYVSCSPANASVQDVIWKSNNEKIVKVDDKGKLTFVGKGTTTVYAQSVDNPSVIKFCEVTVLETVGGLTISSETNITMYVGEKHTVSYQITPSDASNKNVEWESLNSGIASVNDDGIISAVAPGTTQIIVRSTENPSYYELITVTVKQKAVSVSMNYSELIMNRGEYFDMEVTITPSNSTELDLVWESLDTSVVTVSSTGRFTGRGVGKAIVLVRTSSGATSYCTVTVVEPVTSLKLDTEDVTIDVGEKLTIEPIFEPANPTNIDVKWSSSNTKVATINAAGVVEGKARGTTIIVGETQDGGFRAFCLVTVVDAELELRIDPETYRLGYGKTFNLDAVLISHGVEQDADVEWTSSDSTVCSVDENGKIKGMDYGYATITAKTRDEYGVTATCEVRVVREVTSIRLNHTYVEVIQGQTVALKETVSPSNATYADVIFSSENSEIAIVDEDGIITGLQPGETKVIVNAKDNSGKSATCYVRVIAPIAATGVTVSDKQIVLVPGEKKQITTSMKPNNTTDAQMWSSNNDFIATVDGNGTITAHTTGTATITVMTSSGKTATVDVIVLGLSRTTLEMAVYTQYSKLTVDGATTTIRWDVQDPTICEVNNGVITARKVGTTKVTATINGRTLSCTVKVTSNKKK